MAGTRRLLLKNAENHRLKLNVFTGPIFRDDDMNYRGEFRIPGEYWKVAVIVKDDGNLSATAYLQTQKNLLEDLEFSYGAYRTYQVPIITIEALAGLDFGKLREYDPIGRIEGAIVRVLQTFEDIVVQDKSTGQNSRAFQAVVVLHIVSYQN